MKILNVDDCHKSDLIDTLADHRVDNADEYELRKAYRHKLTEMLDDYTKQELAEMIEQEIN